jgi:hypothetical protein
MTLAELYKAQATRFHARSDSREYARGPETNRTTDGRSQIVGGEGLWVRQAQVQRAAFGTEKARSRRAKGATG